jgi:hypothetical protein
MEKKKKKKEHGNHSLQRQMLYFATNNLQLF